MADACSAISNIIVSRAPQNGAIFRSNQFISDRTRSLGKAKEMQCQLVKSNTKTIKKELPGFCEINIIRAVADLRDLNKNKSSANNDRTVWVQNISNQVVSCDKLHNSRNMYKCMRVLQRQPPKLVLQMVDSNDSPVSKPLEVRRGFVKQKCCTNKWQSRQCFSACQLL